MLKTLPFIGQSVLAALPIVAVALSSSSASAAILAPGSTYAGKTVGEWSAEWWKYILSVPADQNPALDPTGVNANINQQGPVFFLAGTFDGTSVTRDITIPADKALLFPLVNFVNISDPSNPETEEQLRVLVTQQADAVSQLNTSIDGTDIPEAELFLHREPSPGFSVTLPDGNIFGAPSGVYSPAVSDGYWLLLEPLSPGQHEISFGGKDGVGNYQDNTYNISVLPVPNAVPEPSTILGVTFGVVGTIFLRRRASRM
jgi:PEP-CTERM motif